MSPFARCAYTKFKSSIKIWSGAESLFFFSSETPHEFRRPEGGRFLFVSVKNVNRCKNHLETRTSSTFPFYSLFFSLSAKSNTESGRSQAKPTVFVKIIDARRDARSRQNKYVFFLCSFFFIRYACTFTLGY